MSSPQETRKSGFVAIVGRPNAGKSTLLNQTLGAKLSIVTPKAQTTRERVLGILTEKDGQIVFVDTPGIHKAKEGGINKYMVEEAREALEAPTVVWYLVDPDSRIEHERVVLEILEKSGGAPVFLLMNKSDLKRSQDYKDRVEAFAKMIEEECALKGIKLIGTRFISARASHGTRELLAETWKLLPEGPLYYPDEEQLSDRPTRFFVAEKIREQLLLKLGEEVPYSCAVEIQKFDEASDPPRIEAVVHVERDSQKGIVIGKGAQKIKEIGQAARKEIEQFLGQKIFLGLQVKVLQDWSKNAEGLKQMGYYLPGSHEKANKGRS